VDRSGAGGDDTPDTAHDANVCAVSGVALAGGGVHSQTPGQEIFEASMFDGTWSET
jgi:hypothetical protein